MTFTDALKGAIRNSLCALGQGSGALNGLLSRAARDPRLGAPGRTAAELIEWYDRAGAGIVRGLCNREPPSQPAPDFSGGQCSGVTYRISFTGETDSSSVSSFVFATGPIGAIQSETTSSGGSTTKSVFVQTGGGRVNLITADASSNPRVSGVSVTRLDGNPDNCGSLPAPLVEDTSLPTRTFPNIPIPYIDNSGNTVNLNVTLLFGFAFFDINAELNVPITVQIGPNKFEANFNLNTGDINFNFGKGNDKNPIPGDDSCCPDYDGGDDNDDDGKDSVDPTPDAERDGDGIRAIGGVVVYLQEIRRGARLTTLGDGSGPLLYVPRYAIVRFLIPFGNNGATAWSEPIDVKSAVQFVDCPVPGGAVGVDIFAVPGVTVASTTLFRKYRGYAPIVD